MKIGDKVRFIKHLYTDEEDAVYEIVEINGDRAIIRFVCDLPIPPQSVAKTSELQVISERASGAKE
jgi:hypothetical protein